MSTTAEQIPSGEGNPLPAVLIRAERKRRCWTVPTMARKLHAAMDDPKDMPDFQTLHRNIRRWERGGAISERYRYLYCQVFGRSESSLFGTEPPATATETTGIPADTVIPESAGGNYVLLVLPPGCHRITIDVAGADEETDGENGPEPEQESARRLTVVKDQRGEQRAEFLAIRPSGSPGAKRACGGCGFPLSRYNSGNLCQACISAGRKDQPRTTLVNGNTIAQARRDRGMTQTLLADRAGLSASLVQKLEMNVRKTTSLATLNSLAYVLGLPISALLTETSEGNGNTPESCRFASGLPVRMPPKRARAGPKT